MFSSCFFRSIIVLCLILLAPTARAATVLVAVAANFSKPMTEITAEFEKAITRKSVLLLNLQVGMTAYAHIKGTLMLNY
jgi:molybdate transport system substrate-binding protein